MATITTTLVSGQNAYVGAVSSRAAYTVSASSGVQGPAGANGATGNTGANGATGNTGVSVTAANVASGNLVLTLSNTSTIDAGSIATNVNATYVWTNNNTFSANVIINGTLTATGNVAGNTAGFAIGYRDVPQNFTNTSFTLALTDAGKHILTQNSGASTQTITIANNTSVAFQTGAAVTIVVQSTGTVAVANGAGVTMYLAGNSTAKSTVTLNSYSMATLLKIGTNTWMVSGTGAA